MKRAAIFLSLLLLASLANADNIVLVDRYFSPYAGSADLLTAQRLMIRGKDALLQSKEPRPNTGWVITGRSLEQFLIWYNIGNLTAVTQHEVFGHGYRLRELRIRPDSYYLTPWGGSTSYSAPSSLQAGKETATTIAGLEGEAIMARNIKMGWMRDGEIDGRMAPTYTQSAQSVFWYTLITDLGKTNTDGMNSNDVASYIFQLNKTYPSQHYSSSQLKKLTYYNLIDPMTYYAYYAFFYYMGTGQSWKFPIITIKNEIKYLPNLRIGYAPYAPETYFENFFLINGEPLYIYGKGGSRSYGAGAAYDKAWTYSKGNIGFKFDFWNQHQYLTSATISDFRTPGSGTAYRPELKQRICGAALSVTGTMKLTVQTQLYGELGGKSSGYLPGYSLGSEIVARIGLTF